MQCTQCEAVLFPDKPPPAAPPEGRPPQLVRIEGRCVCGCQMIIRSREGWGCWYLTSEKPAGVLEWQPAPGHAAWMKRLREAM